jgi:hypothetical protein
MTNFNKTFALISGISLCVLAGLYAVGFAYGPDAVAACIGAMVLVVLTVAASYWAACEIWSGCS